MGPIHILLSLSSVNATQQHQPPWQHPATHTWCSYRTYLRTPNTTNTNSPHNSTHEPDPNLELCPAPTQIHSNPKTSTSSILLPPLIHFKYIQSQMIHITHTTSTYQTMSWMIAWTEDLYLIQTLTHQFCLTQTSRILISLQCWRWLIIDFIVYDHNLQFPLRLTSISMQWFLLVCRGRFSPGGVTKSTI